MNTYGEITKFDEQADGSLIVEGIASTENVDRQGETISAEVMKAAIPAFMADPALREMHQPIAAGVPLEMRVQDDGRTYAKVHVVDKGSIAKIKAGVLRGFSVGGSAIREGTRVIKLFLKELSLVDRACNPECKFTLAKVDQIPTNFMEVTKVDFDGLSAKVDKLATALQTLADKPAPQPSMSLVAKVDGKDVTFTGDTVQELLTKVDKLEGHIKTTQDAVTTNARAEIIAKMDSEGRTPINPETNVAFKAEELAKMDILTLKIVAANAPAVPLSARTALLKVDAQGKTTLDTSVTGTERLEKAWSDIKR